MSAREQVEDPAHVRLLVEAGGLIDPIIVHRRTMRVIDGAHRMRAAVLRGFVEIPVRFFDGSDEDAFVLAVQLNVRHGLPLTLKERKTAAERIIGSHPQWSDRAIAERVGLNAKTVGRIRRESESLGPEHAARIGRDGRIRPVNSAEGRLVAAELLTADPRMSLREVSRRTRLSVGTVRDVRKRVERGSSPVPERLRGRAPWTGSSAPDAEREPDTGTAEPRPRTEPATAEAVRKLARDPSLRATETGRALLRVLMVTEMNRDRWEELAKAVPGHCVPLIRSVVLQRSQDLRQLADMVPCEPEGHG
ncbi:ParB/RepB/Spo0J family partition protein [Nocardiopsis sp. CNT312]|uniref:ParB/RepB/Spo0J family partition protein n=1 Tax=Nocardiopsis sp. CNT312 TaxID=1137268 RepID=UPI0026F3A67B|nr:ParB N-terminal domain-containing protein [Nocardiopsis sp. CNT312]